jgi:hypothetical protein
MTQTHPRSIAAAASGLAGCLLLAACGSSSPTHAHTPADQPRNDAANSSAAPAGSTGPPPGSSSPTSGTSSAPRPSAAGAACTLITEHDVTSTVGADPGKGSAFSSHGATQCQYGGLPKQLLIVNVNPTQGRAGYDRIRNSPKLAGGTGLSVVAVTGVGDQAFELSGLHTDAIYLTKGDALIVVGFSTQASPPKGGALALAKIAAGRF